MRTIPLVSSLSKTFVAIMIAVGLGFSSLSASDQHHGDHGHEHPADHTESHGGNTETKGHHGKVEEPIAKVIIHHVMDSHDWHFMDIGETPIALHLPWIIYNSEKGLQFFGSTHSLEEDPNYLVSHDHVYNVKSKVPVFHGNEDNAAHALKMEEYAKEGGKYAILHHSHMAANAEGVKKEVKEFAVYELVEGVTLLDFSMTKTALQILLVAIIMLILFLGVAKSYKKREGQAPKGLQSFMEPLILFVREDVAKPYLHGKHDKFVPYLLTLFFFVWIANLLGLTPLGFNITGNTTITIMLAMISFFLILKSSTKDFWMHIFWFPGVPLALKPLMLVVEFMGLLTKPVALAIRLFANISAGHFMVLALICLIFILGDNGESIGGALGIMPLSIVFTVFIFCVELIVAAVQAFVFCLLTAVFIGQAMESHDHGDEHAHDHKEAELAH